jgi:hypothetical protein
MLLTICRKRQNVKIISTRDNAMLYRPDKNYPENGLPHIKTLYVEPKYDGHWLRISRENSSYHGEGHAVSVDTGLPIPLPNVLARRLIILPNSSIVDGELIWPNHPAAEVPTAIKANSMELVFMLFSASLFRGMDLTGELYLGGRGVCNRLALPPFLEIPGATTLAQILQLHKDVWPTAEGCVVKQYWYANWWKAKPVRTCDVVVQDFTLGTAGKWKDLPNAILMRTSKGRDLGKCGTGFTDAERMAIIDHVGLIAEISYDCMTEDGKFRFPRFQRWRSDKFECLDPEAQS